MRYAKTLMVAFIAAALIWPSAAVAGSVGVAQKRASKHYWSKRDLRAEVTRAAIGYGIPESEREWLRDAAVDIVFVGRAESHGDTKCRYGSYRGIFQFHATDWNQSVADRRRARKHDHGHAASEWRLCGVCSTWRWLRVYRDGGRAKIRQHWAATYGR